MMFGKLCNCILVNINEFDYNITVGFLRNN